MSKSALGISKMLSSKMYAVLTVIFAANHIQKGARTAAAAFFSTTTQRVIFRNERTRLVALIRGNALNSLRLDTILVELLDDGPQRAEASAGDIVVARWNRLHTSRNLSGRNGLARVENGAHKCSTSLMLSELTERFSSAEEADMGDGDPWGGVAMAGKP